MPGIDIRSVCVHDRRRYVCHAELRDLMHFAVESIEQIVLMYSEAVLKMPDNYNRKQLTANTDIVSVTKFVGLEEEQTHQ